MVDRVLEAHAVQQNVDVIGRNRARLDLSGASGGYLYAETGSTGTVDEFAVNGNGTLVPIGSVTGLPPGIEGIAAK